MSLYDTVIEQLQHKKLLSMTMLGHPSTDQHTHFFVFYNL